MTNERDPQDDLFTAGIFVTCSPALKAQIAEVAKAEHRTLSGLICLLLEQRISRRRKRECRPS